jgi:hypothetical protein
MALLCLTLRVSAADTSYKQVLVSADAGVIRVRLPLTDVTGKVRAKQFLPGGFGLPVAPTKTRLDKNDYLEWQIGYDLPSTNSPSAVPQIHFRRNGETKYGHELAKIIFEAVRLGLLSTNQLLDEIHSLRQIQPAEFEENQPVRLETDPHPGPAGFQRSVRRVPQFTKTTPYGRVQIQLKQKQRAVGYQAMVYVCLPMDQVLTMDGQPRPPGRAKSKETVYYDFTRENAPFLLDIIQAFGMASQQHNEDLQKILGKILELTGSGASADRR